MSSQELVDVDGVQIPLSKLEKLYKRAKKEGIPFIPITAEGKTIPVSKVEEILMKSSPQVLEKPKKEVEIPVEIEKPSRKVKRKPQEEVVEEENKASSFQPKVQDELVEEPETVKMYKKLKYTPHEEKEIVLSKGRNRVVSPSFSESVKERIRSVFEPIFSDSRSDDIEYKTKYKPKLAYKRKTVFKPQNSFEYNNDYDYEPSRTQIAVEDFAPKEESSIDYEPSVTQESYPVFQYATFGIPDTYVENYAPEDIIRIKPVTDFEIKAKPKPLIVSQTHLYLLNKLLNEVV
jgi:hypothetical protein